MAAVVLIPEPPLPADPCRARRALLGGAAAVPLALLCGCSTPPPVAPLAGLLRDDAYPGPSPAVPAAESLFALSPAMRAFIADHGLASPLLHEPRRALLDALMRPRAGRTGTAGSLRLEYDASRTRTAAEAFEARAGNCLSLVIMTAAFAAELGVAAAFQAVESDEYLSRSGALTLASSHVNVVLGPPRARGRADGGDSALLVVDFIADRELGLQRTRPLARHTVVAMYFNNRAAEWLVAGRPEQAYWHVREALRHDPGFLGAINTLGVVHQRAGLSEAAEQAFRHALQADPEFVAALGNLVALLKAQRRDSEALPLGQRLAQLQPQPPFHWLHAGRAALAAGDASGALALMRRELRRQPDQHEVHLALADVHLRLGDRSAAEHHLARAAELSPLQDDRRRYGAKLERLRAAAGVAAPR